MGKREVLQYTGVVGLVDESGGAELAAALGILAGQKMSFTGAIPDNFAGAGDLETFGDRLSGLDGFRFSLHLRLALPPKKGGKNRQSFQPNQALLPDNFTFL